MSVEIIRTKPGDAIFQSFLDLKKKLYPEMSSASNENINELYLQSCYILVHDEKVLSRAALYINDGISYENKSTALIGNYESEDDQELSHLLLDQICRDAKDLGI